MSRGQGHYLMIYVLSITFQSWEQDLWKELLLKKTVTIAFIAHFLFKNIRHKLWEMELSSGGKGSRKKGKVG